MTAPTRERHAIVLDEFGGSGNLRRTALPMPPLRRPDEMLVRVAATSVNPIEWKMRQGMGLPPRLWRLLLGSPTVLGLDYAGEVVAVGTDCAPFAPGDAVMGTVPFGGTYTTHLRLRAQRRRTGIVEKPDGVPFDKAAVVPFAGLVAYAGLTTYGGLSEQTPGRVLVVGASGGVGHLAVQMAKKGLHADFVAAVCSSRNEEFVLSCGADQVIAHDRIDVRDINAHFPEWAHSFDLILDCVGIDDYFTRVAPVLLKPTGRFVTAALPSFNDGRPGEDVGPMESIRLLGRILWRRITSGYRLIPGLLGGLPVRDGLPVIARWLADGTVDPHIASTYALDEIAAAHDESERGRTVGKIAVTVA